MDRIITTASGNTISIDKPPDPANIDIEDIYTGLKNQCRYNGQVDTFFSVAAHCANVGAAVYKETGDISLALEGLLHDAHEAYVGDMAKPIKDWFSDTGQFGFDFLEHRIAGAIMMKFGCPHCVIKTEDGWLYNPSEVVKEMDHKAFEHESYYLRPQNGLQRRHRHLFDAMPELSDPEDFRILFNRWTNASR